MPRHKCAVMAKSVTNHIDTQHRHVTVERRREIIQQAGRLETSGELAADTAAVKFPDEPITAIADLYIATDGKKMYAMWVYTEDKTKYPTTLPG